MNESHSDAIERAAADGTLRQLLDDYLAFCRSASGDGKRKSTCFPNLAGFCRWAGCGTAAVERIRSCYPELYDQLCATLEDEALNSELSPTVLSAYLKQRLGYGEKPDSATSSADCGQLRLIFEHDVAEDGL